MGCNFRILRLTSEGLVWRWEEEEQPRRTRGSGGREEVSEKRRGAGGRLQSLEPPLPGPGSCCAQEALDTLALPAHLPRLPTRLRWRPSTPGGPPADLSCPSAMEEGGEYGSYYGADSSLSAGSRGLAVLRRPHPPSTWWSSSLGTAGSLGAGALDRLPQRHGPAGGRPTSSSPAWRWQSHLASGDLPLWATTP